MVSDYNGLTISGGDNIINPDLDIAHELKGWWDNEGSKLSIGSITVKGPKERSRRRLVQLYSFPGKDIFFADYSAE